MTEKKNNVWESAVVTAIINQENHRKSIFDIVEEIGTNLYNKNKSKSNTDLVIPISKIVEDHGISIENTDWDDLHGRIKQIGANYKIFIKRNTNVYRYRFTLAHELSHLLIRRLAGPIPKTNKTNLSITEEEFVVNLLAGAILVPKHNILDSIDFTKIIDKQIVDNLAKQSMVSRSVILKRIGVVNRKLILLWDFINNPINKKSDRALRINGIFPLLHRKTHHYLPLFCKAKDYRFNPNIIVNSFNNHISTMEEVYIDDFGTLPKQKYIMHNIYFSKWSNRFLFNEIVNSRKDFYSMASFIDYKYAYTK